MTTEPDLVRVRREARARRRARARVRCAAALATGVAGAVCVVWAVSGWGGDARADDTPSPTAAPRTTPAVTAPTVTQPAKARDRALPAGRSARPVSVTVPALGVTAPALPMSAVDGVLTPPADASSVGWWDAGARPGDAHGTVVVAGHTVHTGGGAFHDLSALAPGQQVEVSTRRGRIDYTIRKVVTYDRATLAARSSRLFRTDGRPRLLLITCEDWDGEGYRSNTVVYAMPTRP